MALGSIFPTTSKEKAVVIGVETLARVRKAVSLPIVAIGGINQENVAQVLQAGARAVAREWDRKDLVEDLLAGLDGRPGG